MLAQLRDLTGYLVAVLAGVAYMAKEGAPATYVAINLVALGVGLGLAILVRSPTSPRAIAIYVGLSLAAFAFTLLGPAQAGDIRRWLSLGPFNLHAGMLLLPAVMAFVAQIERRLAVLVVGAATLVIALQPDRASAAALLAGVAVLLGFNRNGASWMMLGLAAISLAATIAQLDPLNSVRFVEDVLVDSWRLHPLVAMSLFAALAMAWLIPLTRPKNRNHQPLLAALGCMGGFVVAAIVDAYPVPLIGYGASSIIGYGLAYGLAADRGRRIGVSC